MESKYQLLLSAGIYGRALEEGAGFERRYVGLLRDTGRASSEQPVAGSRY